MKKKHGLKDPNQYVVASSFNNVQVKNFNNVASNDDDDDVMMVDSFVDQGLRTNRESSSLVKLDVSNRVNSRDAG